MRSMLDWGGGGGGGGGGTYMAFYNSFSHLKN